MNAVKAAGGQAARNPARRNASGAELLTCHDSVLARGDPRDPSFPAAVGAFFSHTAKKSTMAVSLPPDWTT
jgi:hypothetical protein